MKIARFIVGLVAALFATAFSAAQSDPPRKDVAPNTYNPTMGSSSNNSADDPAIRDYVRKAARERHAKEMVDQLDQVVRLSAAQYTTAEQAYRA